MWQYGYTCETKVYDATKHIIVGAFSFLVTTLKFYFVNIVIAFNRNGKFDGDMSHTSTLSTQIAFEVCQVKIAEVFFLDG